MKQWPDNICSGRIRYHKCHNTFGFALADVEHGIPSLGSVSPTDPPTLRCGNQYVHVHNYPGQTEEIARRLVACWNVCVGVPTEDLERRLEEPEASDLAPIPGDVIQR